jgi:hypothetical protein
MKAIALLVLMNLIFTSAAPALAAGGSNLGIQQELNAAPGTEYVSGNFPGAVLMPINLWGSVGKPGIHHVPTQTDLVTLLTLAGGPLQDAEMDRITIKRRSGGEEQVFKIDAEELLTKPGVRSPALAPNDIVIVPREKPTISQNTVTVVGFIASMVGLVLAGIAVNNSFKK